MISLVLLQVITRLRGTMGFRKTENRKTENYYIIKAE